MTGMLASVRNLEEAMLVYQGGADVVDLKEPSHGALGAVSLQEIHRVVDMLWEKCTLSATIGDLPADACRDLKPASAIENRVMQVADGGVDYVKVGMFGNRHVEDCLPQLARCASRGIGIVAVFFADMEFDMSCAIQAAAQAGLKGVMLDTARKDSGDLLKYKNILQLKYFVNHARQNGLLSGLAGSLKIRDIPTVLKAAPDYIGFRSALCADDNRTSRVGRNAIQQVRKSIPIQVGRSKKLA